MPSCSMDLALRFDYRPAGKEGWEAPGQAVPGVSAFGATHDAALRASSTVALRAIAELIAKGDRVWARVKREGS
jgi:hypothetical protein